MIYEEVKKVSVYVFSNMNGIEYGYTKDKDVAKIHKKEMDMLNIRVQVTKCKSTDESLENVYYKELIHKSLCTSSDGYVMGIRLDNLTYISEIVCHAVEQCHSVSMMDNFNEIKNNKKLLLKGIKYESSYELNMMSYLVELFERTVYGHYSADDGLVYNIGELYNTYSFMRIAMENLWEIDEQIIKEV